MSPLDYGWLGNKTRLTDTGLPNNMIEMGARSYNSGLGRFLQVDPIEGGSANTYDYVGGDPTNSFDVTGTCSNHNHGWFSNIRNTRCNFTRGVTVIRHWAKKHQQGIKIALKVATVVKNAAVGCVKGAGYGTVIGFEVGAAFLAPEIGAPLGAAAGCLGGAVIKTLAPPNSDPLTPGAL